MFQYFSAPGHFLEIRPDDWQRIAGRDRVVAATEPPAPPIALAS